MISNLVKKILSLLTKREIQKSVSIVSLTFINSILDVIGLAMVLPIMNLCMDNSLSKRNHVFSSIYHFFNFQSHAIFTLYVLLFVLMIFILKAFISIWNNKIIANFTYEVALRITEVNFKNFYNLDLNEYKRHNSVVFFREIRNSPAIFANSVLLSCFCKSYCN